MTHDLFLAQAQVQGSELVDGLTRSPAPPQHAGPRNPAGSRELPVHRVAVSVPTKKQVEQVSIPPVTWLIW